MRSRGQSVPAARCLRCTQSTKLFHRNALHCVTLIRYWCYQANRSTFNAHVKCCVPSLTSQDAGSRPALEAIRDNKALEKEEVIKYLLFLLWWFLSGQFLCLGLGEKCAVASWRSALCWVRKLWPAERKCAGAGGFIYHGAFYFLALASKSGAATQSRVCISRWTQKDMLLLVMIVFSCWMTSDSCWAILVSKVGKKKTSFQFHVTGCTLLYTMVMLNNLGSCVL